jgi:hypothetical protein
MLCYYFIMFCNCVLHMLEIARTLYKFMSNGVCLPHCPFKRGGVTVLCLIFRDPVYRATMYRVIVLLLCAHVIIVRVIVLFTCFCFCIFVFLCFDNVCVDVSLMCESGYIRPLSCVNQWHRRNDKSLVSEVTERYRIEHDY